MKATQPASAPTSRPQPLMDFLNANSSDSATRAMVATALVFTFWQMGGRAVTPQLPSLLLVNAGDAPTDPLDAFIDQCGLGMGHKELPKSGSGSYVCGTPANAPLTMLNCTLIREQLGEITPNNHAQIESLEKRFHDAQATGFGCHSSGPYTRMWNDQMEWITNASDQILLRFDQPADRAAFRKDLLDRPDNLLRPRGVNSSLRMAIKNIAVSGSLPPGEWDDSLVCGVIKLGLPVFFLPHVVKGPLIVSEPIDFILFTANFQKSGLINRPPVVTPIHLPDTEYCHRYEQLLRQRLHQLPGGYELSVLRIAHELQGACYQIARYTAAPGSSGEEIMSLFEDLHALAFRGIVLSIASLAYHGLGFDPGCPRGNALALLRHLRDKGPLTRRELQRHTQSFNADELDKLLTRLAAEGLIQLNDRKVTAVPLAEFMEALYARPEFL